MLIKPEKEIYVLKDQEDAWVKHLQEVGHTITTVEHFVDLGTVSIRYKQVDTRETTTCHCCQGRGWLNNKLDTCPYCEGAGSLLA